MSGPTIWQDGDKTVSLLIREDGSAVVTTSDGKSVSASVIPADAVGALIVSLIGGTVAGQLTRLVDTMGDVLGGQP